MSATQVSRMVRCSGSSAVELQAHAEGRVAVDDLRLGVEGALVAEDLDGDGRCRCRRGQGIDIASAKADFGSSSDELGPSTDFDDLDGGHERNSLYGAFLGVFLRAARAAEGRFFDRWSAFGSYPQTAL